MSIKESLYVVGVVFKNSFILRNFYELIPLTYHDEYNYNKGSKIPYYGIDCSFLSIIPKLGTKGTIEPPIRGRRNSLSEVNISSSFGNSVAVNFQTLMKNFHIKITSSKSSDCKFHITGLTRYAQLEQLNENFIKQLKCIEQIWIPFFQMDYNSKIKIMGEIYNVVVFNNQLRHYNDIYVINWIESLSEEKHKPFVRLIVRYVIEDQNPFDFGQRLLRICSLQTGQYSIFHNETDFNLVRYDIYNGFYTGNIGYNELYLIYIVRKLNEMGYLAGFANIGKEEIRIKIKIQHDNINLVKGKYVEQKEHLFIIKAGGSFTLSSKDSPNEALAIGHHIINLIRSMVESNEYISERNGKYFHQLISSTNQNFTTNIQPQSQTLTTSMLPINDTSSILNILIDEYDADNNI